MMVATVVVVVATHNLAIGVVVGVLVAMILFARRVAHLTEVARRRGPRRRRPRVYAVVGELFFASSNDLVHPVRLRRATPTDVVIDMSGSHIWDASTVAALDAITTKYARKGKHVEIVGLNAASAEMHGRPPAPCHRTDSTARDRGSSRAWAVRLRSRTLSAGSRRTMAAWQGRCAQRQPAKPCRVPAYDCCDARTPRTDAPGAACGAHAQSCPLRPSPEPRHVYSHLPSARAHGARPRSRPWSPRPPAGASAPSCPSRSSTTSHP